ncbi:MAG: HAD-IIA family hydrolase [Euryarchaeota archaeon]|nr:HAD-IIA family hydrolase [Euryarchaeota archaeon]
MRRYAGYIFDMDGVLYRGSEPVPGAAEAIERLKRKGRRIVFVSNNSTLSREDYAEKIQEMGLPIEERELIPATYATARYVAERYGGRRVYAVGALGLMKELLRAGIRLTQQPAKAEVLVTGSDPDISYQKLSNATAMLLRGCPWVSTNADKLYPSEKGILPGTGAVVGALQYITGREPVVIGKPSKPIMEQALEVLGVPKEECLMVGDIIESDVLAGRNVGVDTALVLTGVTRREDVEASQVKPDYVIESIAELEV